MASDCRNCPPAIREHCIQQSNTSPSVKMMMRSAFEAGTDTQQMWGLLQMNCLLVPKRDEAPRLGSLMRRLKAESGTPKAATEITRRTAEVPPAPIPVPPGPVPAPEPLGRPAPGPPRPAVELPGKPAPQPPRPVPTVRPAKAEEKERLHPLRYCLAARGSRHRIALPAHGEIVLGRFDPETGVTPDVDLSLEDGGNYYISRRHARIIGRGGRHEIEDMGSANGTMVNGVRLGAGQSISLQPGDLVTLGDCEFVYNPIPVPSTRSTTFMAYLLSTFSGHRFPLPANDEIVVGRSDPAAALPIDIDLGIEGDAAGVVARRHIKIVGHNNRHYVEDLGSTPGTKLNGVRLRIGEVCLLSPGDHLWLGGYVLAYDMEQ